MTSHLPPVTLVGAPERGVWRLGKAAEPLRYNRVEPETTSGSCAGRFSLFSYGMLYTCSETTGCYAEALAPFRVHPRMRRLMAQDGLSEGGRRMRPGHLPSSWRNERILVRLRPPAEARFLDVESEDTRRFLGEELKSELNDWVAADSLSDHDLHGTDRRITRQIAAWSVAQRNTQGHQLIQGIAFRSGYGGRRCWALLSGPEIEEVERRPILAESPELQEVAREFGLTVW
ncbi:RES domain-containing protein [Streptomyces sp. NPDC006925]|uniref:RES domain-containing protein n=1 Tax=Streptomyces sp. NPDC006925 TaxID=3364768 RepID=UPI0036858AE9